MDERTYLEWASKVVELTDAQKIDLQNRLKIGKILERPLFTNDWLLEAMFYQMKKHGLVGKSSINSLLIGSPYKKYCSYAVELRSDLEKLIPKDMNQIQGRVKLGRLTAEALITWHEDRELPVSAGMILKNANKAMEALNEAFPNYVGTNMFHIVLQGISTKEAHT